MHACMHDCTYVLRSRLLGLCACAVMSSRGPGRPPGKPTKNTKFSHGWNVPKKAMRTQGGQNGWPIGYVATADRRRDWARSPPGRA